MARKHKKRSGVRYSGDSGNGENVEISESAESIEKETQKHLEETARLHREAESHRKESRKWIAISFGIIGLAIFIDHARSKKIQS